MKKIVSLLLAVIMVFSLTATAALAADESKPVTITFLDDRGSVLKVINVAYGESYSGQAPTDTYIDDGYKYSICGWESDLAAFRGQVLTNDNLPVVNAGDDITELTFKAAYDVEPFTPDNVIGDVVDGIFGENTTDLFGTFIQLIKDFFQRFIMFLMNFGA